MAQAEVKARIVLDIKIKVELTVEEARALKAIVGCGSDNFIAVYNEKLGRSYIQPYEHGVKSLFATLKESLGFKLYDADQITKAVNAIKLNPQGEI